MVSSKVWIKITYLFPNVNGATSNYLSILELKLIHVSEKGPWWRLFVWLHLHNPRACGLSHWSTDGVDGRNVPVIRGLE